MRPEGKPNTVHNAVREKHADEETGELVMEEGELVLETASPRWVGTGRVVLDNKGNPNTRTTLAVAR